jgi:hypothetical protein
VEIRHGRVDEQRVSLYIVGAADLIFVLSRITVYQIVVNGQIGPGLLVGNLEKQVVAENVVPDDDVGRSGVLQLYATAPLAAAITVDRVVDKGDVVDGPRRRAWVAPITNFETVSLTVAQPGTRCFLRCEN